MLKHKMEYTKTQIVRISDVYEASRNWAPMKISFKFTELIRDKNLVTDFTDFTDFSDRI